MGDYGEIHWGGSMIEGEVKLQMKNCAAGAQVDG